jgi:D-alanyl-D-alanine carboxypeptidase (penicillin-binding protein 5/6)
MRGRKKRFLLVIIILLIPVVYGVLAYRAEPVYTTRILPVSIERQEVEITWPSEGTAAIGYVGSGGALESKNGDAQVSSASTIKLLTALVVLEQKPLGPDEDGERIYFNEQDFTRYEQIVAQDGSAFRVEPDSYITYRQALEALLIGSANNVAEKLAEWGFGSNDAFLEATRIYATNLKLTKTVMVEPSGFDSRTKTSANDLVRISDKTLSTPVLDEIIKQPTVQINGVTLRNTNPLLGVEDIDGVKTGFTDEAGACLVLSRTTTLAGKEFTLISVVLGQPRRELVAPEAEKLLTVLEQGIQDVAVVNKGQVVGEYIAPWGVRSKVVTREPVGSVQWRGESVDATITLDASRNSGKKLDQVGTLVTPSAEVELELADDLTNAPILWRLEHALDFIAEKL